MEEEEVYKIKAVENIVRAFIHLLPKGEAIDKLLFSLKDAREYTEQEKILSFIESRVGSIVINQLKEINEVEKINAILKEKLSSITEVSKQLCEYINEQNNFNAEIKKLIEESRDLVFIGFQDVNKKLDILLSRSEDSFTSSDTEVISSLFKALFENYGKKLSELKYKEVLESISSIKQLTGYKKIDEILQSEVLSYEAEINLKLGDQQVAHKLSEQIIGKQSYSIRICDYLLYYASVMKDRSLFDDILSRYKSLGVEQKKITMKEVFWQYMSGNHIELLTLLCNDDSYSSIKEDFLESVDANFFAGMSLFQIKKYELAKTYFRNAYEKEKTYAHKYFQLLNDAFNIIDRRSAIFLITESERKTLIAALKELSSDGCVEYFGKAPAQLKEEYWTQRITIALHIGDKAGLEEYEKCPEELKNREGVKGIYADVLYFNDNYEEANKILVELYSINSDFNFITKILSTYLQTGKYEEALTFSEGIKKFDDEGIIYSLVIEAYSKLNDIEKVIEFASGKITHCKYPIYIYRAIGDLFSDIGDFPKANELYSKMIEAIPYDNYAPRILFAKHLKSKNAMEICLQCLEPYLKYSYEAQKLFVYDAVKLENEKYFKKAEEIIETNITGDIDKAYWIGNKIELEFNRKRYHTSLKFLKELYEIDTSSKVAYKLAHLKLLLGDKDVAGLTSKLENEAKPHFIMMAANCYYVLGDYERAESLSLKSIALHGNNFDENLYAQFIRINLGPKPGMPDIAEIEEISNDCTVLLESDSQQIWIGITSRPELLVKENEFKFADTSFFFRGDENVIHLIGSNKNESVVFNKINWIIKDIWKIKTKVVRHCMMEYISKVPDSNFLKLVELNERNPIESMMPILVEGEIYEKQILADYNFRNGIGLPLHQVAIRKGRNIIDALLYVLEKPNQLFFTGEINLISIKEQKIVLSPSSISMLSMIGVLDIVISTYGDQLLVLESTKKYFIDIVDKMNTEEFAIAMSMGSDQGRFIGTEYNKDFKRKRIKFFNEIIQALSKVAIANVDMRPEELDEKSKYIESISRQDYENLKYASENDCIYLVDDLFVRKARGLFTQNINVINTASLLYVLFDNNIDLLLEKIEQLSLGGYNYLFNLEALEFITERLFDKYKIIGRDSKYGVLLKIIHNVLSQDMIFTNNLKVVVNYLNYLYYHNTDKRAEYLILSLLKELWRFISLYNVDPNILLGELEFICKGDKNKILFFHEMLKDIDSDY